MRNKKCKFLAQHILSYFIKFNYQNVRWICWNNFCTFCTPNYLFYIVHPISPIDDVLILISKLIIKIKFDKNSKLLLKRLRLVPIRWCLSESILNVFQLKFQLKLNEINWNKLDLRSPEPANPPNGWPPNWLGRLCPPGRCPPGRNPPGRFPPVITLMTCLLD